MPDSDAYKYTKKIEHIDNNKVFEALVKDLLLAEHQDFLVIDDRGGDDGMDGYTTSAKIFFAIYTPLLSTRSSNDAYNKKIRSDFSKAIEQRGMYPFDTWVFVTPAALRKEQHDVLAELTRENNCKYLVYSAEHLRQLADQHPTVKERHPDIFETTQQQLAALQAAVASLQSSVIESGELSGLFDARNKRMVKKIDEGDYTGARRDGYDILADLPTAGGVGKKTMSKIHNNLGLCELRLGETDKAKLLFEKAIALDSENEKAGANHAQAFLAAKDPGTALGMINMVLARDLQDRDHALSIRARCHLDLNDIDAVDRDIADIENQATKDFIFALKASKLRDHKGAADAYKKLKESDDKEVWYKLFFAQEILLLHSRDLEGRLQGAIIPDAICKDFEEAKKALTEAVKLFEGQAPKQFEAPLYTNLSAANLVLKQYDDCIEYANRAFSLDAENIEALVNKSRAGLISHRYEYVIEALEAYSKITTLPDHLRRDLAAAYLFSKKPGKTVELLSGNRSDDRDEVYIETMRLLMLGHLDLQETDKALKVRDELLAECPDNPLAFRSVAIFHAHQNQLELSGEYFERAMDAAVEANPIHQIILDDYSTFLLKIGDFEKAAEILALAIEGDPSAENFERYAIALFNAKKYEQLQALMVLASEKALQSDTLLRVSANFTHVLGDLETAAEKYKKLIDEDHFVFGDVIGFLECRFRLSGSIADYSPYIKKALHSASEAEQLMQVANLLVLNGEYAEALETAFSALDRNFTNPEIQLAYISVFHHVSDQEGAVQDKHVRYYQDIMENFENRAPGQEAIMKFSADQDGMKKIGEVVSARAKAIDKVIAEYKAKRLSLNQISTLISKKYFEVWSDVITAKDFPVYAFLGNTQEAAESENILFKEKEVIVDMSAALTLARLDRLDLIKKAFTQVYVDQFTCDQLSSLIEEYTKLSKKGQSFLQGSADGSVMMNDVSAEAYEKSLQLLTKVQAFFETCTRVGYARPVSPDRKQFEEQYGSSGTTMVIASQRGLPVVCDDSYLGRDAIKTLGGLDIATSQELLRNARKHNLVSEEEYDAGRMELLKCGYSYVTIDTAMIVRYLEVANFNLLDQNVELLMNELVKKETSVQPIGTILGDLIMYIYTDKRLGIRERGILHSLLRYIGRHPQANKAIEIAVSLLAIRMRLLPVHLRRVAADIRSFKAGGELQ